MPKTITLLSLFLAVVLTAVAGAQDTVEQVMDGVVTRLYESKSLEELRALTEAEVMEILTAREREVLATRHWHFEVNVPVVVSVLRHVEQQTVPFWLEEAGFRKTDLEVTNTEGWKYEVWQKSFPAGPVHLGIGGFDNHRPHYLVSVGPQETGAALQLSNIHPARQQVFETAPGTMTYHDWTELVLADVPEELRGQKFLSTIRGRGKEAALVGGAFRETPFPSTEQPGPIFLTWSEDPKTTKNMQWRTSTAVEEGAARVRRKGDDHVQVLKAERLVMEDLMLANDRFCHWFTAIARGLAPGTEYEYQVGSGEHWSEWIGFRTAPEAPAPFTFFHCSDTHSNPAWGEVFRETFQRNPHAAFTVISGDLVGTGLEREDWDEFLTYGEEVFRTTPVNPAIGNHDAQLGLGAGMYLEIFGLPKEGPEDIPEESAYTFTYSNTQFFVLDVMSPHAPQTAWLRAELAKSEAPWKVAVYHFPPFAQRRAYPLLEEAWGTLFDEYGVDLVLTGHVHHYMRSHPMRGGEVAGPGEKGTVYVTSVSIPGRPDRGPKPDYIAATAGGGQIVNVIDVEGDTLRFRAMTAGGEVKDEFTLEK
jgi:acid phosphatase type 7